MKNILLKNKHLIDKTSNYRDIKMPNKKYLTYFALIRLIQQINFYRLSHQSKNIELSHLLG